MSSTFAGDRLMSQRPAQGEKPGRCGAYAECWREIGKPEGWQGCSLPKGHGGDHTDSTITEEGNDNG